MKIISSEEANTINYSTVHIQPTNAQFNAFYDLEVLFNKHRSPCVSNGIYALPKYWAGHVLSAIKDLLATNDKIKFVDIRDKNSRLILNLHYPDNYDWRIHARVHEIKNLIDELVHVRIRHVEVARMFNYEPDSPF